MILPPGYTLTEVIEENLTFLCRAKREKDHLPVIIKSVLLKDQVQVKRLEHEYELSSRLDSSFTLKPLTLQGTPETEVLVYEDFKGIQFEQYLENRPLDIKRFLQFAVSISEKLSELHQKGIIHKDINPGNLIINPATNEIKIIDFGIATLLPTQFSSPLSNPEMIEGTLPYMSPEQTGRMNRVIDYRTDMYSLGITFYKMLTGQLPFQAQDPIEWVYNHLVRIPIPPNLILATIPKQISAIIIKLISKLAEDRYQSIDGLIYDLKICLQQLHESGNILPFPLGEKDFSGRFQISQKIYGREKEITTILESYENMISTGNVKLVVISGYSGIGKTSLVKELYKPMVKERGFFISGKFDQYKRNIPYATLVEAFKELVKIILSEPDEKVEKWKEKIMESVGMNGQIIANIIPQIELVIGKQPPVVELAPTESRNRFQMVFEKFIAVFSQREHPLTIFLDDLQWADAGSLQLIQQIFFNPENNYIFLIGAYRDNEVYPSHPLLLTLEAIEKNRVQFKHILLSGLEEADVTDLISDSLQSTRERTQALSLLVFNKTRGNPFFIKQFLIALYKENLLLFNYRSGQWEWKMEDIMRKEYTDNVVDLMVERISVLDSRIQELLKFAACIGNKFDIKTLSIIASAKEVEVTEKLNEAISEGIIFSYDRTYKFMHDRIQEAAYSLIPESLLASIHLQIARLLSTGKTETLSHEILFDITNHYNQAIELVTAPDEKKIIRRLNIRAGQEAKGSIAYASARYYLAKAMDLLDSDAWSSSYNETFHLILNLSECEYLSGNFEQANNLFNLVLANSNSYLDSSKVYRLQVGLYQAAGRYHEAVQVGLFALELLGLKLPKSEEEIEAAMTDEIQKFQLKIKGRRIANIVDAPVSTDPDVRALVGLITELFGVVYATKSRFFPLLVLKGANLSLDYGNTEESSFVFSLCGLLQITQFNDVSSAFEFSEASLRLNERFDNARLKGTLLMVHGGGIYFWKKPLTGSIDFLEQAFIEYVNIGDIVYAGLAAYSVIWFSVEAGRTIDEVLKGSEKYAAFTKKIRNETMYEVIRIEQQFLKCLKGMTREELNFSDDTFDEAEAVSIIANAGFNSGMAYYKDMKLITAFLFGQFDEALHYSLESESMLEEAQSTPHEATQPFYHALTLASLYLKVPEAQQVKFARSLNEKLQRLKVFSDNCPENFYNRYALVAAEKARIEGREMDAMRLYEEAIKSARENGFTQNEALAYEIASRFYRERGFELFANTYLVKARDRYFRWGADGKVKQLEELYPFLKVQKPRPASATLEGVPVEQLDVLSIIKASQAISLQMDFEKLAADLMYVVIQQAAAEKAFLFLDKDNQLIPVAEAKNIQDTISIRTGILNQISGWESYAESVVHYVKRSKEKIILGDASVANQFSNDAYILAAHPKSLVCLPILKQAKLVGVLYLENNLFTEAFPADKVLVLELLASQAAISIENSQLFSDLQNSRQQLQDVMNNSSAMIFIKDLEGKYLFINRQFENLFNISNEKIVGMTDYEIWPQNFADMVTTNDAKVIEEGKPITFEETVPETDGNLTYITVKFLLRDATGKPYATCGISTDITDRKRAEDALIEKEARIRRLVDSNIIGIFFFNINGIITEGNEAFRRIIGYSSHDIQTGKVKWTELTPDEYKEADAKALSELENTGSATPYEKEFIRQDGSRIPLLVGGALIGSSKDQGVAFVLNLSELKQAEKKFLETQRNLFKTSNDLDNFIYTASHDLKAPISNLEGLISMIRESDFDERQARISIAEMMDISIEKFKNTIRELEEISIVQKEEPKDIETLNFSKITDAVIYSLKDQIESTHAIIRTDFKESESITFSKKNLISIVYNLISNSIKFRHPDRIPEIIIRTSRNANYMILTVSDNGLGIAAEMEKKLFGMFKRLHAHEEGTGVGLYIVKRIVENAGGRIEVDSEVGKGTIFRVFLKEQ